jgi:Tol biopolymer transport system component
MNYENESWSPAYAPSFADTSANDISPSFSPDGKTLYFSSSRKLPSGKIPERGNVLWRVDRAENGWGTPSPMDSTVSRGGDYAPAISANGNLYFTYGPFRSPDWNIYIALPGTDALQQPDGINSPGYEDGAFIAPDESYLIFESDRPGGVDGSIDLYISFRNSNGKWETPLNMGTKVNSPAAERFARITPDGKYLFFGSKRRVVNGEPNFDIYWIDSSVIESLRGGE